MFQICLTSEKSAAFQSYCFSQDLFSVPVASKARTYSALPGLEMLFLGMRELQVLTGLLLVRPVVKRKGPEFISIPVPTLPSTMSPSLGLA